MGCGHARMTRFWAARRGGETLLVDKAAHGVRGAPTAQPILPSAQARQPEIGPMLVGCGHKLVEYGRCRAKVGPNFGGSKLIDAGSKTVEVGPDFIECGSTWQILVECISNLGTLGPSLAGFGRGVRRRWHCGRCLVARWNFGSDRFALVCPAPDPRGMGTNGGGGPST